MALTSIDRKNFSSLLLGPGFSCSAVDSFGQATLTYNDNDPAVWPVSQGGTGAATVAAANQALTPSTVTLTEVAGATTVDWSQSDSFFLTLNANDTITFSNAVDGQSITVTILNTASNYTVTWPGTVKWPGANAPIMSTGAHYDVYTFVYNAVAGYFFGSAVQNF